MQESNFIKILTVLFAVIMTSQMCYAVAPPQEGIEPPVNFSEIIDRIGQSYKSGGLYRAIQERKTGLREAQPSANLPVLLGRYSDSDNYYSTDDFQNLLFGVNPTGSMIDYYTEISYEQFSLDGTASEWVTAPGTQSYYDGGNNGLNGGGAEFSFDLAVINDPFLDFSQFDNDGPDGVPNSGDDDGFVDVLVVVHTGGGAETGDNDNIWSHRWSFQWAGIGIYTTDDPAANGGFILINDYIIQPETSGNGAYGEPMIEIGVFCHEFGHALGLPDLYDTDYSSSGIGRWGLMSGGSYGGDGQHSETPVHMSAWPKVDLGWIDPIVVTNNLLAVEIPYAEENPIAYKLWTNGESGSEYFLVENRQQIGFDSYLYNSGLCIWHIDENMPGNSNEFHKKVDLEAADGQNHLDYGINRGDPGDVYPGTSDNRVFDGASNPNSHDYADEETYVAVSNISDPDSTMTADLNISVMCQPANIHVFGFAGGESVAAGLTLFNHDDGASLNFDIAVDTAWLSSIPESGAIPASDEAAITILCDPADLEVGQHSANLSIEVSGAIDSLLIVPVTFDVYEPQSGVFVWEGVENERDYSGTYFYGYLTDLGLPVTFSTEFPFTLLGYDAVLLSFGCGENSLTRFEGDLVPTVQTYLENGGRLYLEGRDALGWDQRNNTALHNLFSLDDADDGPQDKPPLESIFGQNSSLAEDITFTGSTQTSYVYVDIFTPGGNGIGAFLELDFGIVAAQGEGAFGQKTFCFSYALAELVDGEFPNIRNRLSEKLLEFFEIPGLAANFIAVPNTGQAPLAVQFSDYSYSYPQAVSWAWDFDNDGTVDSEEQNPVWAFQETGLYSVRLEISNGQETDVLVREDLIHVFGNESALLFDGQDDYVTCVAGPDLNLTEAMTIEAWVNPAGWGAFGSSGAGRIVDKGHISFFLNGQGTNLPDSSSGLWLSTTGNDPGFICTPRNSITLDGWQHLAFTYDGLSSEAKMYIDGSEQELTFSGGQPEGNITDNSSINLLIGNSALLDRTFDGIIDEVRIWNTVRSSDEIQANKDHYLDGENTGLVAYWRMNEGNGALIGDGSVNDNTGLINGAQWVEGITLDGPVAIENDPADIDLLPTAFMLWQNYPNPWFSNSMSANRFTVIRYALPVAGHVTMKVYNTAGQAVKTLIDEKIKAGYHQTRWDGTNQNGESVASGLYFYRIDLDADRRFSTEKRLVLLR